MLYVSPFVQIQVNGIKDELNTREFVKFRTKPLSSEKEVLRCYLGRFDYLLT